MDKLYPTLVDEVTSIISKSRMCEESFLQNPRTAAKEVIKYMHENNMIVSGKNEDSEREY